MQRLTIYIDGQIADYESIEKLPFSLSIKTDDILSLSTATTTEIDNAAKRLALPGTTKNQKIEAGSTGEAQPTKIILSGNPIFSGLSRLVQTERSGSRILGYGYTLFSGATVLFNQLSGRTLRGLDLGSTRYDLPNIEASFNYDADSGPVVWAPVYYGDTEDADNNYTPSLLRPHVFFKTIIDQIWTELRVTVDSALFETSFFKRFVYMFGVGDSWSGQAQTPKEFKVSAGTTFTTGGPDDLIIAAGVGSSYVNFPFETSDPSSIFSGTTASLNGGVWQFVINVPSISNGEAFLEISGYGDIPLQKEVFGQFIGPIAVSPGAVARIRIDQIDSNIETRAATAFNFQGYREEDPGIGQDILVASCLHGEKISDFLAGISHMFNLAWHFDPVTRKLTVDPRFDFKVDDTEYEGFYKRLSQGVEDWSGRADVDQVLEQKGVRPFGNYLSVTNQDEDSYWYKRTKATSSTTSVPFLGGRFDFSETGDPGSDSENPYFENMILTSGSGTNISFMPMIVPNDDNGIVPLPNYESGPKYGYFYGDIEGVGDWKWNGSIRTSRPAIWMQPPNVMTLTTDVVSVAYANYKSSDGSNESPGLMDIFYLKWLTMLERGKSLEMAMNFDLSDIRPDPDLFRTAKQLRINGASSSYIFANAKQFQPLKSRASRVMLMETVSIFNDDRLRLSSSTQLSTSKDV